MPKWNDMRKKRMWGVRIEPDVFRFHYLVWNYMMVHINSVLSRDRDGCSISRDDLELLVYLALKNRVVTAQDFADFPLGYGRMRLMDQMRRFVDAGLMCRFEGHGSSHCRGIPYSLTEKARRWVSDIHLMSMGFKKIPMEASESSVDFVRRRNAKCRVQPNWYGSIVEFNAWVDEVSRSMNDSGSVPVEE